MGSSYFDNTIIAGLQHKNSTKAVQKPALFCIVELSTRLLVYLTYSPRLKPGEYVKALVVNHLANTNFSCCGIAFTPHNINAIRFNAIPPFLRAHSSL